MPSDETVVQTAAEAAEGVILAHYRQSELTDFDVTVTFEEGVLDVDVYVNAPDDADEDRLERHRRPQEGHRGRDGDEHRPGERGVSAAGHRAPTASGRF